MPINRIFVMVSLTVICFLFVVIISDRLRGNLRKNISFILVLHHALHYQQKKVQDTAEFANILAEKHVRDNDFSAFALAWLQMHRQQDTINAPYHVTAENTWTAVAQEAHCLKKILDDNAVTNIPLVFCARAGVDMNYAMWSKCVETNTRYSDINKISVKADNWQSKMKMQLAGDIVSIHIDQTGNRWKWTVD